MTPTAQETLDSEHKGHPGVTKQELTAAELQKGGTPHVRVKPRQIGVQGALELRNLSVGRLVNTLSKFTLPTKWRGGLMGSDAHGKGTWGCKQLHEGTGFCVLQFDHYCKKGVISPDLKEVSKEEPPGLADIE